MRLFHGILCVLMGLGLGGGLRGADPSVLRIGGTGSGMGPLRVLGEGFAKAHPGAKVLVVPNLGSSGGIRALLAGQVDLAVTARPLEPGEAQAGAVETALGRTPFVFIAHRGVGQAGLTLAELAQILEGRRREWADGQRVRAVLRPVNDVDSRLIAALSPRTALALQAAQQRPGMVLAITDQEALLEVGRIPGAVGASCLAQLATEPHAVKVLAFNGVTPTLEALARGTYPLAKRLALVAAPGSPALAQDFLRFCRSPRARPLLAAAGLLPPEDAAP